MKRLSMRVLLVVESLILLFVAIYIIYCTISNGRNELFREESTDGKYRLIISELGTPDWPFGKDHLRVTLYGIGQDNQNYRTSFKADVANNGMRAEFDVEWKQDGVKIILYGAEQPTAYYILPYEDKDTNN